jgi:hypothetical protein
MARTAAEREAQNRYLKKVIRRFSIDLNVNTDVDIIEALERNGVAPYIKRLIREDLAREVEQSEESRAE